ncbi:Unknown protein [Striga hermonthica]|uniref:Uncharacterized protein n=1 Tax=Striga hermonthica TaxID=68872 RepID=A0A9N7NCV9_STRHE|nr:Unknown protein [Striga hermonthica]
MAKSNLSVAIHCILILVLSVGILRVEGGECLEGLPTVDVTCRGSQADQVCWIACQQRHGPRAEAWCREGPGLPGSVACMCSYPC